VVPSPDPELTSILPLGPSHLLILPTTGVTLDLYFKLAVRLELVASMHASWSIHAGEERVVRTTNFVRDDELSFAPTTRATTGHSILVSRW
jgi:hypothetical protein